MNQVLPDKDRFDLKAGSVSAGRRSILSGTLQDDTGSGQFVLVRREQSGFSDSVDFVPGVAGIGAYNFIEKVFEVPLDDAEAQLNGPGTNASFDYQFSINPADDSAIKCSYISVFNSCIAGAGMSISLIWQGDAQAFLQDPEGELSAYQNGNIIRQGEKLKLPTAMNPDCSWKIVVPSNSVSISVEIEGDQPGDAEIILFVDAVFSSSNSQAKIDPRVGQGSRPGKMPHRKILDIINQAEAAGNRTPGKVAFDSGLTVKVVDDLSQKLSKSAEPPSNPELIPVYDEPSAGVASIGCQKIDLFPGEDIVLGISGLFENYVEGCASYVSLHLPEWLFLDQVSGDIMGTVPLDSATEGSSDFTVYALDEHGHSAKANIEIDCHEASSSTGSSLHDHEVEEGAYTRIETKGLFADFGLDMQNLEYSATGMPTGLSIDGESGIISGKAEPGSASEMPYEIVITAADNPVGTNGVGMRFLLQVTRAAKEDIQTSALFSAIEKLYRLNRECETILAQHDAGSLLGFVTSQTTIGGVDQASETPEEQEILMVEVISPNRTLYLHIRDIADTTPSPENIHYSVQIPGETSLPEWIETTPEGFVQIKCSPERQFVDLEIKVLAANGVSMIRNIRVDTFAGEVLPEWISPLEKQLHTAVAS